MAATEAAQRLRRGIGSPALFAIVYITLASALYFALGVAAKHAIGMTPFVFLAAALFFVITSMTYTEGASLHQERGGSTVFARYAFNEVWSFVAGWALLLDYVILVAVTVFTVPDYIGQFWGELSTGALELVTCFVLIAAIAAVNVRGVTSARYRRLAAIALLDLALQLVVIGVGFLVVFDADVLLDPIDLGTSPTWREVIFSLGIAAVVFTGLESSSGLAGEVRIGRRGLRRLIFVRSAAVILVYTGISVVALSALPVEGGQTELGGRWEEAPVLGVVRAYGDGLAVDVLAHAVAAMATVVLVAAASGAMLGMSRLGVSLATNRQIPSVIGRLHPTRFTPVVLIALASVLAAVLILPKDLEFLIGIYAFGALLAISIAHLAVVVLRYREPDRDRPYRMPGSVRIGGGELPLPAAAGVVLSVAAWVSVIVLHEGARWVGLGWMTFGIALYLLYRTGSEKPLTKRVTVPAEALLAERTEGPEVGSILVPITGSPLDDDIVQTAGRLASAEYEEAGQVGATIEAIWVFEVPMSLPLDARLPTAQTEEASRALARAKAVGEEYEGVTVATAKVRARRAGAAIVDEARRRGVEVIVLAAEEQSRIRGGSLLGGRGGALDNYVGDMTKYVIQKAHCRVILTAPKTLPDRPRPEPTAPR